MHRSESHEPHPNENSRAMSSHEVGQRDFVTHFYTQSRLHFIGTWKERYARLVDSLPATAHGEPDPGPGGSRWILHVDMDAFFASVTLRDRPDLMNKAVVISAAAPGQNAEISCPNYPARARGIRAGMWMTKARELCPEVISLNYEFDKYTEVAEIMYRALYEVTPFVNGVSCDEAYLDITHVVGSIEDVVEREAAIARIVSGLRENIWTRTRCKASVGVGANMLLARLATAKAKPDGWGIFNMDNAGQELLAAMPIRDLPQVGWRGAREMTEKLNIETCGDLQQVPLDTLKRHFGPKRGQTMYDLCRGIDGRPWIANGIKERQTIGTQISWGVRMQSDQEVVNFLDGLCEELVQRIERSEKNGFGAKKVSVTLWKAKPDANPRYRKGSLGHGECTILQRTVSLQHAIQKPSEFLRHAKTLLDRLDCKPTDVRGLGVSASSFARPERVLRDFFTPSTATEKSDGVDSPLKKRKLESSPFQTSPPKKRATSSTDNEIQEENANITITKSANRNVAEEIIISSQEDEDDDPIVEVEILSSPEYTTSKKVAESRGAPSGSEENNGKSQESFVQSQIVIDDDDDDAGNDDDGRAGDSKGDFEQEKLNEVYVEDENDRALIGGGTTIPSGIKGEVQASLIRRDEVEGLKDDTQKPDKQSSRGPRGRRAKALIPLEDAVVDIQSSLRSAFLRAALASDPQKICQYQEANFDGIPCADNRCEAFACKCNKELGTVAEQLYAQSVSYVIAGKDIEKAQNLLESTLVFCRLRWGSVANNFVDICEQIKSEVQLRYEHQQQQA